MMIFRCTACTRDHYGSQPATCAGCGLSSFALIPLTTPTELQAETLEALEESPPTPRDVVEGVISRPEHPSTGAGLTEEGEIVTVAALRPVHKPQGTCSQVTCDAPATHRFTWPGHPEAASCHEHALKAVRLAEHMGFFLEAPALDAPRPA